MEDVQALSLGLLQIRGWRLSVPRAGGKPSGKAFKVEDEGNRIRCLAPHLRRGLKGDRVAEVACALLVMAGKAGPPPHPKPVGAVSKVEEAVPEPGSWAFSVDLVAPVGLL